MDKVTQMSLLIDFYGKLLTDKQYEIVDLYYNNDYSLAEISENLGISRQGVHDSLKRSEKLLELYENKLNLLNKFNNQKQAIIDIQKKLIYLKNENLLDKRLENEFVLIIDSLEKLLSDNN